MSTGTVKVLVGIFFCGESDAKPYRGWSCGEKAIEKMIEHFGVKNNRKLLLKV